MASSEITDWEDVPVDGADDWEDVPLDTPNPDAPGMLETAMRAGGEFLTGGWSDKISKADNLERTLSSETGKYVPEMTDEEGYRKEQARTAAAKAENPKTAMAAQGAAFLGSGGARLLAAAPKMLWNSPAAIRALGTPAGWKALGLGAAKGGAQGAGMGALAGAGMAEPGKELEGAGPGALAGGLTGALIGAGGGAAQAAEADKAARAAAAAEKSREQALLLAGLEGKQRTLGGGRRAKAVGQAIYDEELPGGGRLVDELVSRSPDDSLALSERLRDAEGKVLGGVRERLAGVPGAGVDPNMLKGRMADALKSLPTEAQAAVSKEIDRLIDSRVVDGYLPADGLRAVIDEVSKLGKFGAPNMQAALGDKSAMPFQRMYGPATDVEKGLVEKHFLDDLPKYLEGLRKYGIFDKAAMGADVKVQRVNRGKPPVKLPEEKPGLAGQIAESAPVIGPPIRTVRRYLQMLPGNQKLPSEIDAAAGKAEEALAKWLPQFEKAIQEGPRAVAVLDHLLMQKDPEYAEVRGVQVTAHQATDVAAGPPSSAPAPKTADIRSTPDMDRLVLEAMRADPPKKNARSETGWLMQDDLAGPEDPIVALSPKIKGKENEVDFNWKPKRDRVRATVHTHPNKLGGDPRLNQKNANASDRDHALVTKGRVPAYIYGTDGKVKVLELIDGKIVQRLVDGQD